MLILDLILNRATLHGATGHRSLIHREINNTQGLIGGDLIL